ncbi:hypothetical protein BHM03_00056721, partial [Ensete ventricosum]
SHGRLERGHAIGQLRVLLRVRLLRFKVHFFIFFNRFYHGKLPLFAVMVAAPKFVVMPTKVLRRSVTKFFSRRFLWQQRTAGSKGC